MASDTGTATTPRDMLALDKLLSTHTDLAAKAPSVVTMYTEHPFLLHINWNHDGWKSQESLSKRDVNLLKIRKGGKPVWAAANWLLQQESEPANRMVRLFTYHIRNACVRSSTITMNDGDEKEMRTLLENAVDVHHKTLPLRLDMDTLIKADMVRLFLAVLADVWHKGSKTANKNTSVTVATKAKNEEGGKSEVMTLLTRLQTMVETEGEENCATPEGTAAFKRKLQVMLHESDETVDTSEWKSVMTQVDTISAIEGPLDQIESIVSAAEGNKQKLEIGDVELLLSTVQNHFDESEDAKIGEKEQYIARVKNLDYTGKKRKRACQTKHFVPGEGAASSWSEASSRSPATVPATKKRIKIAQVQESIVRTDRTWKKNDIGMCRRKQ
jgi:hypothetical protein